MKTVHVLSSRLAILLVTVLGGPLSTLGVGIGPGATIILSIGECVTDGGSWQTVGCGGVKLAPTNTPTIVAGSSAILYAYAGGEACDLTPMPGTISVSVDPPDAIQQNVVVDVSGQKQVNFFNPTKSGKITITASAYGECPTCTSWDTAVATAVIPITIDDGDGDNGSGGGGGGCDSCRGPRPDLGNGSVNNNSVDFRLHLGPTTTDQDGGFIWLKAYMASTVLATPLR
jgi:hypothetical protein